MSLVKEACDDFNSNKGVWSPKEGTYPIRILPPKKKGLYYVEYGLHWSINVIAKNAPSGRLNVACLRLTLGQECPMCKAVDQLYAEARNGDVENKTIINIANKVRGKKRYVVNIVDMDNPKSGVLQWSYPPTGFSLVHSLFNRWGNITSPTDGQIIEVTFSTKDKYTSVTNVQPTGDKTEIPVKDWREKRHDLEAYVEKSIVTAAEMRSWLVADEPRNSRIENDYSEEDDADTASFTKDVKRGKGRKEEVEEEDDSEADSGQDDSKESREEEEESFDEEAALKDPEIQELLRAAKLAKRGRKN
jgi:phage FluMu protein Com